MKVTNRTPHELIAFGWHIRAGAGEDVRIPAGTFAEVNGPDREMDIGAWLITLPGQVICHEGPDNKSGFQVLPGKPLMLKNGDLALAVGHSADVASIREASQLGGPLPERRCENPACNMVLPPSHTAVYCSNQCALDDA